MVDKVKVWDEFKCPVCGNKNFSSEHYMLMDADGLADAMKGRHGKRFEVKAITCRDCGFIALKK